jgi:flagellar motility protein MotE (MotC chaperone)
MSRALSAIAMLLTLGAAPQAPAKQPAKAPAAAAAAPAAATTPAKPAPTRLGTAIEDDLARQRAAVDARARALDMKEKLLAATEKRLTDRGTALRQVAEQLQAETGKAEVKTDERMTSLAKVYSTMKPRDAAIRFAGLDPALQVQIAQRMKERALSALLAQMPADGAAKLTAALAKAPALPAPPTQTASR